MLILALAQNQLPDHLSLAIPHFADFMLPFQALEGSSPINIYAHAQHSANGFANGLSETIPIFKTVHGYAAGLNIIVLNTIQAIPPQGYINQTD